MLALFKTFVLRDCLINKVRTLITVGGIALGIAVFLAISLANGTALSSFRDSVDRVAGKANLEVSPVAGRYMDEAVLGDLTWLWMAGGKYAAVLSADVCVGAEEKEKESSEVIQLVGIDMLADQEFFSFAAGGERESRSLANLGGILVGKKIAFEEGLAPGALLTLSVDDRTVSVPVTGILEPTGLGEAYSGRLLVCDIPLAQEILGEKGKISRVEIIVGPESLEPIREKLNRELPAGLSAEPPGSRTRAIEKMTRSFEYNLRALTFIALIVGMFLIYNTIAIAVIRRRVEIGTLRAMGLRRRSVVFLLCGEAALIGLAGSVLGAFSGILLADWSLAAVADTYKRLYFNIPLDSVALDYRLILLAVLIGVTLTVVAALPPAVEGSLVEPITATRRLSNEEGIDRFSSPLFLGSLLLALGGWYLSGLPPVDGFPLWGYLAALLYVFALALALPLILKIILPVIALALDAVLGIEGKLAALTLRRTIGRTSVAVATLAVGIAMMISLAIMIGSFRETVTDWARQTLVADLWMRPAARDGGSHSAGFPPALEQSLARVEGVRAVEPWAESPVLYRGRPAILGGARFDVVGRFGNLSFVSGRPSREVCPLLSGNKAIVSESFALRHKISPGDRIELPVRSGTLELTIVDIYYDYVSDAGYIVIPRDLYVESLEDDSITSFAIVLQEGADPERVRTRIVKSLGGVSRFSIRTTGELRQRILEIFDKTFAVTYALHTIAIVVAILSVMNALFALIAESRREFGILSYLGMSARSLRRMVLVEAGLLGLLGSIAGTSLGFVLSVLLIYVINKQSFGWTVRYMVPGDFIIQSFFIVFLTAVLSGLIPARMASRTPAPEVVRSE
ncbi:MAG: FtsX-like permease family protein [Candidatus Obscuribacterales bacterium]